MVVKKRTQYHHIQVSAGHPVSMARRLVQTTGLAQYSLFAAIGRGWGEVSIHRTLQAAIKHATTTSLRRRRTRIMKTSALRGRDEIVWDSVKGEIKRETGTPKLKYQPPISRRVPCITPKPPRLRR